jgi:hypothetical protein
VTVDELTHRGSRICRACAKEPLVSVLDLGRQPLANELPATADATDSAFALHLRVCPSCGLGQVGEYVLPDRLFGDYPYLSSVSASWTEHAKRYATRMDDALGLAADRSLVLEIASNDGYLLRHFLDLGVPVLGVEPAANVADIARSRGVDTVTAFFGRATAEQVIASHGHPRLVVANNVMAHVPDLDDFVGGIATLCDDRTVVTVENPSFVTLLDETQFDTIYHEHYSYLSAHAVARVVADHGMELVGVEDLPTHGGSYRYTIARRGSQVADASVSAAIERELVAGLLDPDAWSSFADRSRRTISQLREWFEARHRAGDSVAGYGAAAKGNTLLNAAGAARTDLVAVADGSPEKQGRFLPGSRVPVIAPRELTDTAATDVLILPWNIAAEICPLVGALLPQARVWIAVPEPRRLA